MDFSRMMTDKMEIAMVRRPATAAAVSTEVPMSRQVFPHRPPRSGRRPVRLAAVLLVCLPLLAGTGGCQVAALERSLGDESPGACGDEQLVVSPGQDYFLPAGVAAEPFSGYVNHPLLGDPAIGGGQRALTVRWAYLEPERGQYNWSAVENALNAAEAGGYKIQLYLQSMTCGGGDSSRGIIVPNTVPAWVIEDFGITESEQVDLGWEFSIRVIPAWRPAIRSVFEDLIEDFGRRGFAQREGLGSAYIHGISPSRGEEFWLTGTNIIYLEQLAGLTPQLLEDWLSARQRVYAEAFAGQVHKLAWVGLYDSWRYCGAEYAAVALRLVHTAWDLGIGTRHGALESYHRYVNEPAFGQAVDANGYLTVDETIPPIATLRYFGEENEEYGDAWTGRFGSRDGEPQRYRFSMLRALQMRLRFLWTSAAGEEINPALSQYARLSFGKTVANSPDAWAYLSETPASVHFSRVGAVKNFERWLLQRDVPGGLTVPAERVDRAFNSGVASTGNVEQYYDYVARRTDLATDNPYIYFDLDDRFQIGSRTLIKVEFRDDSETAWRLEYLDTTDVLASTPAVNNRGSGEVKTATFTIDGARFAGGLPHGMDFRLVCDGPQDLTVRWVRVIRDSGF